MSSKLVCIETSENNVLTASQVKEGQETATLTRIRERMQELGRERCWSLKCRHELGKLLYGAAAEVNWVYGSGARRAIAEGLGRSVSWVNKLIRFSREFTDSEVDELSAVVLKNGQELSWDHVCLLWEVNNQVKREKLLKKAIRNSWTSTELADEILKQKGFFGLSYG